MKSITISPAGCDTNRLAGSTGVISKASWRRSETFFTHQDSNKMPSKKPTLHVIPYCWFTNLIVYYLGSKYYIHGRPESSRHVTGDDFLLGNLKFVPKGEKDEVFGMPIPKEMVTKAI
nr:E-beta-farnesene synthase [Tanacetum cinerariifolium]